MKKNLYLLFILIFNIACEDIINWDYPYTERLVVDGHISSNKEYQFVILSSTSQINKGQIAKEVNGATVTVFDGTQTFTFSKFVHEDKEDLNNLELNSGLSYYRSDVPFAGEVGKTYTLTIKLSQPISNQTEYTAKSKMLQPAILDSVKATVTKKNEEIIVPISVWGKGNLEEENAYYIEITFFREYYDEIENKKFIVSQTFDRQGGMPFIDDNVINENFDEFVCFTFNSLDYDITLFEDFNKKSVLKQGDSVKLTMFVLDSEYANAWGQIADEIEPSDPLGLRGPREDIDSNISGNGLGFFYTSNATVIKGIVEEK